MGNGRIPSVIDELLIIEKNIIEKLYKFGPDCVSLYVYYMKKNKWGGSTDDEVVRKALGWSVNRFKKVWKLLEENGYVGIQK